MSEGRRGGERRRHTPHKREHRAQARDTVACESGRVLHSVLRPVLVNPHYAPNGVTRAVVGRSRRYRGQANSGNRDELAPGSSRRTECGSPRATAQRWAAWCVKKRKEIEVSVPARKRGPNWFGCPHVDKQLQKSVGGIWPRISSAYAQKKLRQGRVNGGLARSERWWVKPLTGAASEGYAGDSASNSRLTKGEVRTKTQGGARVPSSGQTIAKSGELVAGLGR